jgi:hypothetical protein
MPQSPPEEFNPFDTKQFDDPAMAAVVRVQKAQLEWTKRQVLADETKIEQEQQRLEQENRRLQQEQHRLNQEADRNRTMKAILTIVEELKSNLATCQDRQCLPEFETLNGSMRVVIELLRTIAARVVGKKELDRLLTAIQHESGVVVNTGDQMQVGDIGGDLSGNVAGNKVK